MKIELVKQKHDHACSIACAAMVTGENYDDLINQFGNNFHKHGIDDEILLDFLGDKGFSTVEKVVTRYNRKDFAREEMLKPFAPAHLVKVKINADSSLFHWVVMTDKGKFLCPLGHDDAYTRNSYWIFKVVGLWKE